MILVCHGLMRQDPCGSLLSAITFVYDSSTYKTTRPGLRLNSIYIYISTRKLNNINKKIETLIDLEG